MDKTEASQVDFIRTAPREVQDRTGMIRMWPSRTYVRPLDLKVEDIRIGDIAHHLSHINRYTGGTPWAYSVAQHSLEVCRFVNPADPTLRLAALLHDGSEAYLNDIASPVKRAGQMSSYRDAEEGAMRAIFARYEIPWLCLEMIKWADDHVFKLEIASWKDELEYQHAIVPVQAEAARHYFLMEFERLQDLRQRRGAIS